METIIFISLIFLLTFCILATMSHSLLRSAMYLGFASATLGVIMYVLGATWAAVIEVSVCSGLITVIYISAISLSNMKRDEIRRHYNDKKRMAYLPITLIITGVVLVVIALTQNFTITSNAVASSEDFRYVLWNSRQIDVLGQIVAILVGGIAVDVLFRNGAK